MEKYPRFSRRQDGRCKLDDADIADVQAAYAKGVGVEEIARFYNVSPSTVRYWINAAYRKTRKGRGGSDPERVARTIAKKRALQGEEFRSYLRSKREVKEEVQDGEEV